MCSFKKLFFCNTFFTNTELWEPQVLGFQPRNRCRKEHGTEPINSTRFLSIGARQAFKTGSQNHAKINRTATLDPHMSFLLLPLSPRVPPRCQNNSQGCKNGCTRPPKSQAGAPQMITIFCVAHKNVLRTNTQKPVSQHTFQQRNLENKNQRTISNNATSHQPDHNAQLSRAVAILVARQQPVQNK